jgi:4-hydroxy-tetrahydrodipicolinate reductase
MKIGIFGNGKLSHAIQDEVRAKNEIAEREGRPEEKIEVLWTMDVGDPLPSGAVDIVVDASVPPAVRSHIDWAVANGVSMVVGTTGWSIEGLDVIVGKKIGLLVASNFSVGVAVMKRIAKLLGALVDTERSYDIGIFEHHHKAKIDAPSGTAISLADAIVSSGDRYSGWRMGEYKEDKVMVSSLRSGHEIGLHEIIVDSPLEEIRVSHKAKDRRLFAVGAVAAMKWMKARKGLYTIDDVVDDLLGLETQK